MSDDRSLSHRHSIRLRDYDYRNRGAYFVTICALNRECLFGVVHDDAMGLNAWGEIAEQEWIRTGELRPAIMLDEFVVMPNHLHGIVFIAQVGRPEGESARDSRGDAGRSQNTTTNGEGTAGGAGRSQNAPTNAVWRGMPQRPPTNALGTIVNGYKAAVTRQIRSLHGTDAPSVWQRNYYEHVIRNDDDLDRIRHYIRDNPAQWALDAENPERLHR